MTHTLADVDIRALEVPGLQFRHGSVPEHARLVLIGEGERGAVEMWMTDLSALPEHVQKIGSVRRSGGVELHSAIGPLDPDDGGPRDCDLLAAGRCWPAGGVSLYGLRLLDLVLDGDSATLLGDLAFRYHRAFGGDTP